MQRNQKFSVEFSFPVHFTTAVFSPGNETFVQTVRRLEPGKCHRVLFILDSNVAASHHHLINDIHSYMEAYPEHLRLVTPPIVVQGGEASKNDWANVLELLEHLNAHGMDRQSYVAIIGGGAVLDMACFAAAIAHRGIRAIRIPTTVLAQGDSGVGVKNGINLFGKKNFIGTFLPPFAVINDFDFIATLEPRDKIAGIAEGVKVALLKDPAFFEFLEQHASSLASGASAPLAHVVQRSAELHLDHIGQGGDPFELGSARPLDFGHWSAHRLESMTDHSLRHGEAMAIGVALDVIYAAQKRYLSQATAERIITLLESLGFELWSDALTHRDAFGSLAVLAGIQEFREHLGGQLHITLLRDVGKPFDVHEMDESVILKAIALLQERSESHMRIASPLSVAGQ